MRCHRFYFSTPGNLSPLMLLALKQRAKHVLFSIEQNLEYGTGVFIFWDCGFAPLNVEMANNAKYCTVRSRDSGCRQKILHNPSQVCFDDTWRGLSYILIFKKKINASFHLQNSSKI